MDQNFEPQVPPIENTATGSTMTDKDARLWAMLCHLTSLSWLFTGVGGIVGPLVCWLIKKNDHPFIDENGKESLNFQISMHLYYLVGGLLIFCFLVGIPVLIVLSVVNVVLVIIASVKASNGEHYRYPLTIRFIQ
jgi:uncharacterized Tic20 family protein